MATAYLLDRGHTRIAHLAAPLHFQYARDRLAGYQAAMDGAGVNADPGLVVESDLSEAGAHAAMLRLLSRPDPPTAVFAASDVMSVIGTLQVFDYSFWNVVMAGSMFMTLPAILFFVVFQRWFVKGISLTGLKG